MDVYLSKEAWQGLEAEGLEPLRRKASGLLLGHRRGGRFYVERIHPVPFAPFPSAQRYLMLDRIFMGTIIGFYFSGRRIESVAKKLPPFSTNKLCLEFERHSKRGWVFKPAVVEYTNSFQLVPVTLARRPKRKK